MQSRRPVLEDRRRSLYHEGDCIGYAKILGLDLGESKSVCWVMDAGTGAHLLETIGTTPAAQHELLVRHAGTTTTPARTLLVVEASDVAGWVHDLSMLYPVVSTFFSN